MLVNTSSVVLTTCSPEDDPRSLHWAQTCHERFLTTSQIVYPIRSLQLRSLKASSISPGKIERLAVNLHGFSKDIRATISNNRVNSVLSEVFNRISTELRKENISAIHRTVLNKCLDQIVVAFVTREYFGEVDCLIGTDIPGLCGSAVYDEFRTHLIYDAQEITIFGFTGLSEKEIHFWLELESILLARQLKAVTVSPAIAEWHNKQFGLEFSVVPNFEPRLNSVKSSQALKRPIRFVYYGGCAEKQNITSVLNAWTLDRSQGTLTIIAPKSSDRNKLELTWKRLNRSKCAVHFRSHDDATSVCDLLAEFDVGVLPYSYSYPYSEASPNKFGQYLAAGLAVLANRQGFTSRLIEERELGVVTNFEDALITSREIEKLCDLDFLNKLRNNSSKSFDLDLNWEFQIESSNWLFLSHNKFDKRETLDHDVYVHAKIGIRKRLRSVPFEFLDLVLFSVNRSSLGTRIIQKFIKTGFARRMRDELYLRTRGRY